MELSFEHPEADIKRRREWVFLIMAGLFLGTLTMMNILGVSRFIDMSFSLFGQDIPMIVPVGVLPYPITFLCTDMISEIYGKRRANQVVWVGLLLNVWLLFILWIGGAISAPVLDEHGRMALEIQNGEPFAPPGFAFYNIRSLTISATVASMIAYLVAQLIDVNIFHWLKKRSGGKYLWLRNNVSTLTSQLIDSTAVILLTYFIAQGIDVGDQDPASFLFMLIVYSYVFKFIAALLDTIPAYAVRGFLLKYLKVEQA